MEPLTSYAERLAMVAVVRGWRNRLVLTGATLRLRAGEVTWLGGSNGAGKTTLLRVAAGILIPEAGTVTMQGLDPDRNRRAYQQRLGFLAAGDRGLYARLTTAQNLEVWAGLSLVPDPRRSVAAAMADFDLLELAKRRVDRMSMGQRHRVRLAMTFLHEPDVVLLDEPQTSLDDHGLALLDGALARLVARGGAALWCSPSADEISIRTDVRLRLRDGTVGPA